MIWVNIGFYDERVFNMKKVSLLCDYEAVLLGNKKSYRLKDPTETDKEAMQSAKYLMRFVFDELLHWSPMEVKHYFNADIIEMFKLDNCMEKANMEYPKELTIGSDYFFIASWLYPDKVPYNKTKIVTGLYEDVLDGRSQFSNRFFQGTDGKENFKICMFYSLSKEFFSKPISYIYEYFTAQDKASRFMKKVKLYNHFLKFYDDPLEAVHDALPDADKDETLYTFSRFNIEYGKTYKNLKKNGELK